MPEVRPVRLYCTFDVVVLDQELDAVGFHLKLYDVAPVAAFHETVAAAVVIFVVADVAGVAQVDVEAVVVNQPDPEYADVPAGQTVCTWNS